MKDRIKAITAFTLLAAVCILAFILDCAGRPNDVYPGENTMIRLYGEAHGAKQYYDIEFELWKDCYKDGSRDLFCELPYYSAEFLNIWMKEDSDELLDTWFKEIEGTQSGNAHYKEFFQEIKEACPETVFRGTDVGHQNETTGARYLRYLEEHGLTGSEEYELAKECIRQGDEFYSTRTDNSGISPVREKYLVCNFEEAYKRCGGKVMGIYGSYHTSLDDPDLMAGQLKAHYGDVISSVKLSSIAFGADRRNPYAIGFCLTGLLYLIMLFVPNILWARGRQPEGYEQAEKDENRVLLALERIGQVLATTSVLIFTAINPYVKKLPEGVFFTWDVIILIASLVLMIFYECYWARYFRSERTLQDMYSSYAGFPVAGATLPVLALFLMGVYSRNLVVMAASVILGTGHIGIHLAHRAAASASEKTADPVE